MRWVGRIEYCHLARAGGIQRCQNPRLFDFRYKPIDMKLSATILLSMVETEPRLFRFALLFREYAVPNAGGIHWHRLGIAHHSEVEILPSIKIYRFLGRIHRDQYSPEGAGPAHISINNDGDKSEYWYRHGLMMFSEDAPTQIVTKKDGLVITSFYKNDCLHRLTGPAYITSSGVKNWYKKGRFHRVDGPAIDSPHRKEWIINDKTHRVDGPAVIEYNHNSEVMYEVWYRNNQIQREDGPAVICWNATCTFPYKLYCIYGPNHIPFRPYKMWFTWNVFERIEVS